MLLTASIMGSHLYRTASEASDIDIRVITLNEIDSLFNSKISYSQKYGNKIDIAERTLSEIINGLLQGNLNDCEIVLSDLVIYDRYSIIPKLQSIFLENITQKQKMNIINSCLGMIRVINSRIQKAQRVKPKSIISKCEFILWKVWNQKPTNEEIETLESKLLKLKTINSYTSIENIEKDRVKYAKQKQEYRDIQLSIYKDYIHLLV